MNRRLRAWLGWLTGTRVYSVPPPGVDLFFEIRASLPELSVDCVFDVGANVGKYARECLAAFPEARVYCFEPIGSTFEVLKRNLAGESRARLLHLALAEKGGEGTMLRTEDSVGSRLVDPDAADAQSTEGVRICTIDALCADQGIERIALLKIDTEGADLRVLEGAARMLEEERIDLIQVEAGMNPENTKHVGLDAFRAYLEPRRYRLFRLYNQAREAGTGSPQLRRCDPVFISEPCIERNRRERRRGRRRRQRAS